MIPYVRRKQILEAMQNKEIVYFEELANALNVSLATIRRDLISLSEDDLITILKGGAAQLKQNVMERSLNEKLKINEEEKSKLGIYAATLVNEGDFIYLGPGTTEHWMIKHLKDKNVTVVTNGAFHLDELRRNNIETIVLGGIMNNRIAVITGAEALKQVDGMNFDKSFLGVSGFTIEHGAMTSDEGVSNINRAAMKNSNKTYILLDSTKLGITSRFVYAKTDTKARLITTSKADIKYRKLKNFMTIE